MVSLYRRGFSDRSNLSHNSLNHHAGYRWDCIYGCSRLRRTSIIGTLIRIRHSPRIMQSGHGRALFLAIFSAKLTAYIFRGIAMKLFSVSAIVSAVMISSSPLALASGLSEETRAELASHISDYEPWMTEVAHSIWS